MFLQNSNKMCFAIILFFLMSTLTFQTPCSCSQIKDFEACSKSPKCMQINSKCSINQSYTSSNTNEYHCFNYPQEECRLLQQCAFHQGQCQDFIDCQMLQKQNCQQSSIYCVPDGQKCIEKTDCELYLTQIACQYRNRKDEFCHWNNNKCQSVKECTQLPKSLKTDVQCRAELSHCTVALEGGCIDSPNNCEQHKLESQCHTNFDNKIQCFWNASNKACYERLCENGKFETNEECQSIKEDCITDGMQCIDLSDCSAYNTLSGCKQDKEGNACAFVNEQCLTKSCATAPEYYTLFQQCSQYLIGTQCVPTLNGGCKAFPNICSEFETSDSCFQLQDETECFWNSNNQQCKLKECSDAPLEYEYQDCLKWMVNCIGLNSGGCTKRPSQCEEIEDPQQCDYNLESNKCFYDTVENKCKSLNCQNLKLPQYSNHTQCSEKLASCTYSAAIGGCYEFTCSNIVDPNECDIDYMGYPCNLNGCITKTCLNAPYAFNDHVNCEQWNSICTLDQSGQGCESKYGLCSQYEVQSQCYSTLNQNKCIWKDDSCQDILCIDSPSVSYDSHEKCLNEWKVIIGKCTLAYSGQGCQLWPSTCIEITQSPLCLIGTMNGESCFWFNSSCQAKDCSNAPHIYKSMSQCSKWLSNCTFDNSICVDKSTVQCNSMNLFTTHSECYEWNTNCTIAPRILEQGCEEKRQCSEYKQLSQCKIASDGHFCEWNAVDQSCSVSCSTFVSKDYSRESCESFNDICTISEINYSCKSKGTQCSSQVIKQECLTTSDGQQCVWDLTLNVCKQSQCVDNTTATTDQECLKYYKQGYCELKINSDGTYGIGCVQKRTSCSGIGQPNCNKTYLQNGSKCYFINGACTSSISFKSCSQETQATSNEECQRFYSRCQLSPLGTGCVDAYFCDYISSNVCNQVEVANHLTCHYENSQSYCYYNYYYYYSESTCINGHDYQKRKFKWVSNACYVRQCTDFVGTPNDQICQDYQSFCHYDGTTGCTNNNACSDVTEQVLCDTATDINGKFCAWDPIGHFCLSNELCENQKTAAGVDQDRICYDWQSSSLVCVANPQGDGCILRQNCDQIKIFIQCKVATGCYWVQGLNCQDKPMCHFNTTAILEIECRLYNPSCVLNWNTEKGCNYKDCSYVPTSQCNSIILNDGSYCYLNASQLCQGFTCSSLIQESDCNAIRSNGSICYWNGTSCTAYPCNLIQNVSNNDDCSSQNVTCQIKLTLNSSNQCRDKICIDHRDLNTCNQSKQLNGESCFWSSSSKCEIKTCSNINITSLLPQECYYWAKCRYDSVNRNCMDCATNTSPDSTSICLQRTCSNYNWQPVTLGQCQAWLSSCTSNPSLTGCIDKVDCKQAPKTYTTHSQCESYLPQCTVARNQPTCVPLPLTCREATDIQCYMDASGNKCYWSNKVNECTTLNSCDLINQNVSTHQGCNQLLDYCTVNSNLQGCAPLQNCTAYSQDQCYISIVDQECVWYDSQCQNKSCFTADLATYTNIDCRAYFDSTCSLNEIGTKCIISPQTCSEYNQFQCSSPNSMNFYGIPCIETLTGQCIERVCENSLRIINSISLQLCESISPTCSVGDINCRNRECSDIQSSAEFVCQNALPKVIKCQSTPAGCVDRGQCQDVVNFSACNFDDKGQQCEWVNDACQLKTCETAPINLKLSQQCQQYFSGCIPKALGGCMERLSCPEIEVEEECNIDNANLECNWDLDLQVCQYKECSPECGDGIVSKGFEDCDDGNTLPYDGCYKCQIHCSLGCATCFQSQCQECEIGWKLVDKCETVCGDGLVLGKEDCDDMNELPYDGCFECKYQCHKHCKFCEQGDCKECQQGWYLKNQECITHCGDGILVLESEQCDDHNQYSEDGCDSDCQIEIGWICTSTLQGQSECVQIKLPLFQLSLITILNQPTQQVDLSFSEAMRYKSLNNQSLAQALTLQILNTNLKSNYNISIEVLKEPTQQLQNVNAKIFIEFYSSIPSPVLNVTLQNVLVNQYDAELQYLYQTIRLSTPYIINATIMKTTQKATLFNEILVYILLSIAVIALLSGKIQIFWNLLDTLQVLSYLRYINIQFPEQLDIYFYVFSHLSLQPLIELIRLDEIYTIGQKKETIFIQPSGKMQIENANVAKSGDALINAFFLINIQSVALVLIFGFLGYYTSYLILKYINPIRLDNYLGLKTWPNIEKIRQISLKIMIVIIKQCMRSIKDFYYSGILRLLQSSVYKITFASFLSLNNPKNDTILFTISYYASGIVLVSLIYFVGYVFSKSMNQFKIRQYSVLHEGIDASHRWSKQYYTVQTIKKICFMLIIVYCQDLEVGQSILISMTSLAFLAYMQNCQPLINKFEQRKIMFTELIISINTLLFASYQLLNQLIVFQILPLLNIALFSSILVFQLISDIYEHKNNLVEFTKRLIKK